MLCLVFVLFFAYGISCVKAIYIDGRIVCMSDSESVGPGSIPGRHISNFFLFFFFFLLKVIMLFSLSLFQSRMIYQNKSQKL